MNSDHLLHLIEDQTCKRENGCSEVRFCDFLERERVPSL